jgi:hypothetical protein
MRVFASIALLLAIAATALASRQVTADERAKLVAAIAAANCSGGKMVWDDKHYEVDEVMCNDGRRYDMKFDASFKLLDKRLEK